MLFTKVFKEHKIFSVKLSASEPVRLPKFSFYWTRKSDNAGIALNLSFWKINFNISYLDDRRWNTFMSCWETESWPVHSKEEIRQSQKERVEKERLATLISSVVRKPQCSINKNHNKKAMKHPEEFMSAINTMLYSWGSDTPQEAHWALVEFIDWINLEYGFNLEKASNEDYWENGQVFQYKMQVLEETLLNCKKDS